MKRVLTREADACRCSIRPKGGFSVTKYFVWSAMVFLRSSNIVLIHMCMAFSWVDRLEWASSVASVYPNRMQMCLDMKSCALYSSVVWSSGNLPRISVRLDSVTHIKCSSSYRDLWRGATRVAAIALLRHLSDLIVWMFVCCCRPNNNRGESAVPCRRTCGWTKRRDD